MVPKIWCVLFSKVLYSSFIIKLFSKHLESHSSSVAAGKSQFNAIQSTTNRCIKFK